MSAFMSKETGLACFDTDDIILASFPGIHTIRSVYHLLGKESFMEKEAAALSSLADFKPTVTWKGYRGVVSLGGGACDNAPVMDFVTAHGTLVYLAVPEDILFRRISIGGIPPFLDAEHPRESFHQLYSLRNQLYGKHARLVIRLPDCHGRADTFRYLFEQLSDYVDAQSMPEKQ